MRGKRERRLVAPKDARDHPRMRGEKINKVEGVDPMAGSPPRVRGKGAFWVIQSLSSRITPACAGKRSTRWKGLIRWQDHPRVCGEKVLFGSYNRSPQGSPPRARGKALPDRGHPLSRGITPAYAGKSAALLPSVRLGPDHPRVRGEKKHRLRSSDEIGGSPPRTRGKAIVLLVLCRGYRITPAYAGKSGCCAGAGLRLKDHPRVRGEKSSMPSAAPFAWGSPPRTRGKVSQVKHISREYRITPAYAGKSY